MNGISLVMATLGRVDEVRRFVECLAIQTTREFELIVVDQNHDDRLLSVLARAREMGISLLHIRQVEPNQCMARNVGLANASMDIVAFPDDDCWYAAETLELVIRRMRGQDAPSGLVIRWIEQDRVSLVAYTLDVEKLRQFREVGTSMITQFYERKLLRSIGGFDVALGLHSWFGGGEDTDLMLRVLAAGATMVYVPEVAVHHEFCARNDAIHWRLAATRARNRSRGTGALYAKHRLSFYVILRGCVAPIIMPVVRMAGFKALAQGIAIALGRIEGFIRWNGRIPR